MSDLRRFTLQTTFALSASVACGSSTVVSHPTDADSPKVAANDPAPRAERIPDGPSLTPGAAAELGGPRWTCLAPPRATLLEPLEEDVIRSPRANRTFTRSEVASAVVTLRLPRFPGGMRPMIALDHHPARPAAASLPLQSLLSEWEAIEVGTHRLAVFWLDEQGLAVRSSAREVLVATRTFVVERPHELGAGEWLLVSPSGTLNGVRAPTFGHPGGLSLVHLGTGPGEAMLEFEGRTTERGSFGPADCALHFERSGDYRLWLSSDSERTLLRTITVNRDLDPEADNG